MSSPQPLEPPAPARTPPAGGGFASPLWLPGGHAQTIIPARLLPLPDVSYQRERWDTPDSDFIDLDHALPAPVAATAPLLVLFHGLEGDARSHYARLLMQACTQRGWRGLVVHFRGCSGVPNRLLRAYHSGDSEEIDWILRRIAQRWPDAPRHAVGISLGGNALAKWAGERGRDTAALQACVAVSAPLDLAAGGRALGQGFARLYALNFLRSLVPKALAKARQFPGQLDAGRLRASRSLYDFDDAYTAPVHGFASVEDYWSRASALPWLGNIRLPTLLLNARNDPFVPGASLPAPSALAPAVHHEFPDSGGHVGFYRRVGDDPGRDPWYLRQRIFDFFQNGT